MINTSLMGGMGRLAVVLALVFSVVLAHRGLQSYRLFQQKAQAQVAVTESVERWRESYMALGDSVKKWEKNYQKDESVEDLVSLVAGIELERFGLAINTDLLSVNKIDSVMHKGMDLGLTRICLATTGAGGSAVGDGVEVTAADYRTLLGGIKDLSKRPDIYIGNITLKGDKQVASAVLGEFCVLLRRGN